MANKTGKCMCGAVTVILGSTSDHLRACHCDMCRRWTGSSFMTIHADGDELTYEGPVKSYASSDWAERTWCDQCGSTLWYRLTIPGREMYGVSAGLFENAAGLTLTSESYIDRKPIGFSFAGDHKRITEAQVNEIIAAFLAEEPK